MRVLLDTNVVVSALIFGGTPRKLLRLLSEAPFELWTSRPLLKELAATLAYNKLQEAVNRTGFSVETLLHTYADRVLVVPDANLIPFLFPVDPGDALVIEAALAAHVHWLVSGDHHLLNLGSGVPIETLTVAAALARIEMTPDTL